METMNKFVVAMGKDGVCVLNPHACQNMTPDDVKMLCAWLLALAMLEPTDLTEAYAAVSAT